MDIKTDRPVTRMHGRTTNFLTGIVAEIREGEAALRFGDTTTKTPSSQVAEARDCDELVEFFTTLAAELRRQGSK